jgi:hypothetical protein
MRTLKAALLFTVALGLAVPAQAVSSRLAAPQAAALKAGEEPAAAPGRPCFTESERAELAAAQQAAPGLLELRGGEVSDRDLTVAAVTLVILAALIIIF